MMNPDDLLKEFDEMSTMLGWFGENMEKLPFGCQMEFLGLIMRFCEKAKPLYIRSLMAVEGCGSSGLDNIVKFPCNDSWDDEEDEDWED